MGQLTKASLVLYPEITWKPGRRLRHTNCPIRDRLHRTSHYESSVEPGSAARDRDSEENMLQFA